MKLDHATGLSAGMVVASCLNEPISANRLKLGARPASMSFFTMNGSRPSRPSTITFLSVDEPPHEQAACGRPSAAVAAPPAAPLTKSRRLTPRRIIGLSAT
jgi:hypothetical protein